MPNTYVYDTTQVLFSGGGPGIFPRIIARSPARASRRARSSACLALATAASSVSWAALFNAPSASS